MPRLIDIYEYLNEIAPFDTACQWDNAGISVGDINKEIKSIAFALDVTKDVIKQAASNNIDLIITHHPLKIIDEESDNKLTVCEKMLIDNNIAHIALHTNYDIAKDGVNEQLIKKLGLITIEKVTDECLYICELDNAEDIETFTDRVKDILKGLIRYSRRTDNIKRIAVCSGSGSDYISLAKEYKCDALLTGDGGHHAFLNADELDISLICAGHFETEYLAMPLLCEKVQNRFTINCFIIKQQSPIITK